MITLRNTIYLCISGSPVVFNQSCFHDMIENFLKKHIVGREAEHASCFAENPAHYANYFSKISAG